MKRKKKSSDDRAPILKRKREEPRLRWYCVRTKQAQETKAAVNLADQGFPAFLPVENVAIRHGGRLQKRTRPLFPRYVFVQINVALGLHGPIASTRGVVHLLCDCSGDPHPIPDAVIMQIRKREELEKLNSGELRSGFEPGDRLQIAIGAFAGLEATYIGEAKGEATVIVKLFGRDHVVPIPLGRLPIGTRLASAA